ncbi:MAG: sigma-70 family RNA polymerase sigma factor [Lentisphaerae bacterium]|jgi:RNA polymerase sigma-70 factor (ECF subfamily)|nr:sigma-70 family RNA polymerase sigma factor [Lentisphaerota bacterium]
MATWKKQITEEATDEVLFDFFRNRGEERAFEILVGRHSASLMRFIRGMLGQNSAYADDVYQETWIKVINNSNKWKGGSFKAWLTRIARNTVIDVFRRQNKMLSLDSEDELGISFVEKMPDLRQIPGEAIMGEEAVALIVEEVMKLPPGQKEVFLMRVEQELSFREIAELLEIPLNTALGRMHYAVNKLREVIADKIKI